MKVRVLIVDDEPKIRSAWERLVARQPDMELVGSLANADDLEQAAAEAGADVALLDLTMPGRDPLEALAAMRDAKSECRVIVYSAHRDSALVERSMEAGAWGFVDKLERLDAVLAAMRAVVEGETSIPSWFVAGRYS